MNDDRTGWTGPWPEDGALALSRDEVERDDVVTGEALSAIDWYRSEPVRRFLATEDLPMTGERLMKRFGPFGFTMLVLMQRAGLVEAHGQGAPENRRWGLSREGRHTLNWAGAVKPSNVPEKGVYMRRGGSWASQLSHAIAQHYGVSVAEMIGAEVGQGVLARARLCFALFARGWETDGIDAYFAWRRGLAASGVERWRRMRGRA
jgi:hypothetical protein